MSLLKAGRPKSLPPQTLDNLLPPKEICKMSLNIDKTLYKEVKQFALDKEMTLTEVLIASLREYIRK